MNRRGWSGGLLAAGLLLLLAGAAEAGRVPIVRSGGQKSSGSRTDVTVPYLTNGKSAFGVYDGVAPKVYSSGILDDPNNPQAKRVYNLPFYGASQAFGSASNGATPRTKR